MQELQQSLQKLTELKSSNLISDEEYKARRIQLVDGYIGVPTLSTFSHSSAASSTPFTRTVFHSSAASSTPYAIADIHTTLPGHSFYGLGTMDPQQGLYALSSPVYIAHTPLGRVGSTTVKPATRNFIVKVQPLPSDATRESLVETFSMFGEVSSAAVKRGVPTCGYITFASPHGATLALAQGQLPIGNTTAFITLAAQRKVTPPEAGPSNGIGLFNLPFSTTHEELQCMLKDYEGLQSIKMVQRKDTGQFKGYAFVYFDTVAHATQAKAMLAGLTIGDQHVDVKFAAQSADDALTSTMH
eukprot:GGOE01012309.1.p1 GENE.GGOE01012309.1~~GGOE01012309.1.p1  ORF type:complete len:309 (+),score=50.35 GGOE01012309.1:28-927(+)